MRDVDLKDYGEKFAFLGRQDGFSEREITEIDLSSDLFIALMILEKLENNYSKNYITTEEYERACEPAIDRCKLCHALVKEKYPSLRQFVDSLENVSFPRALFRLESGNTNQGTTPNRTDMVSSFLAIQRIVMDIGHIRDWEVDEDSRIKMKFLKRPFSELMDELQSLGTFANRLDGVQDTKEIGRRIEAADSSETIDSETVVAVLDKLYRSVQKTAKEMK